MVIFNKKWKKYNEIQLTKNKMDLNIRKMTNHPPSPVERQIKTQSKYNNKKYNIIVLYKIWKKYKAVQLTKKTNWTSTIEK